jgi:hypothetical protein
MPIHQVAGESTSSTPAVQPIFAAQAVNGDDGAPGRRKEPR